MVKLIFFLLKTPASPRGFLFVGSRRFLPPSGCGDGRRGRTRPAGQARPNAGRKSGRCRGGEMECRRSPQRGSRGSSRSFGWLMEPRGNGTAGPDPAGAPAGPRPPGLDGRPAPPARLRPRVQFSIRLRPGGELLSGDRADGAGSRGAPTFWPSSARACCSGESTWAAVLNSRCWRRWQVWATARSTTGPGACTTRCSRHGYTANQTPHNQRAVDFYIHIENTTSHVDVSSYAA
jgi:hypothetical protein